jgi:hypothetical protein
LIRIDLETNDAIRVLAEIKKDRALSLSFDNNLLTEVKGMNIFWVGIQDKGHEDHNKHCRETTGS